MSENQECSIKQNLFRTFINDKAVYHTCVYSFCAILIICAITTAITISIVSQKYAPELIEGFIRYSQSKCK